MKPRLKVDTRTFRRAARDYARTQRNKTIPEILNHKAPFVILRTMRMTPKTAASRIIAELGSPGAPNTLAMKIIYSRARAAGVKITMAAAVAKAKAMIRARRAAVRYVSLGWLKALSSWRAVMKPLKSTSLAWRDGFGIRATAFRHEARFRNAAPGVHMGVDALEKAMSHEARGMAAYAARRLRSLASKHSGKRSNRRF